jgi:peptidoglycan L-alanyl-D-glutamate endopeptidase CwlK
MELDPSPTEPAIQDEPHFQLRPDWAEDLTERDMLAELRSRKDAGTGVYV